MRMFLDCQCARCRIYWNSSDIELGQSKLHMFISISCSWRHANGRPDSRL